MDIGVGGKIIVAVAEPLLDILHRIVQVQHDGGAAVPQVMEPNGAQAVLYQNLLEFLAHEVRLEQHAHLVHADEIQVFPVIAGTADLLLSQLPLPQPGEIIVGVLAERQAPAAGLGLGGSVPDGTDHPIADLLLDHRRLDVDPAILEIDGTPPQTQQLGPAQAIEACQEDRYRNRLILGHRQQLDDLLHGVRLVGPVLHPAGLVRQIRRIIADVLVLHRPLEATTDDGMVLDDRVGAEARCHFVPIIVLQIAGGDTAHRDSSGIEVGGDMQLQHVHILVVGGHGNVGPVTLDPHRNMLGQGPIHRLHGFQPLILIDQVSQHGLSLALVAPCRKIQGDPFLHALAALILKIQNSVKLVALDLQTSGHGHAPPLQLLVTYSISALLGIL